MSKSDKSKTPKKSRFDFPKAIGSFRFIPSDKVPVYYYHVLADPLAERRSCNHPDCIVRGVHDE